MLDERNKEVLHAIVQCYINRPDPVGSRYVTKKYPFKLSSATIRNIMADLEEMGFLEQPHTSAGRIPTDKGYRFYVNALVNEQSEASEQYLALIRKRVRGIKTDVTALLRRSTEVVSSLSRSLVFAMPMNSESTTLNRIQLFRYRDKQTVAMFLSNEGLVKSRVLDSNFGLTQKELDRISDYLNSEFSGYSIEEIRAMIINQLSEEKALADILASKALAICDEALTFPEGDLIMSGFSELLGLPEFADRINEIARAIEDKRTIIKLIDSLTGETEEAQVVIGSEMPLKRMRGLSIVTAPYHRGGRLLGRVGIIGPTRMDYSTNIPMVEQAARFISTVLSR